MAKARKQSPDARLFERARQGYDRAAGVRGEVVRAYRIADTPVCLRFAGEALIPEITPAFAHLAVSDPTGTALEVCLWDTASTGVEMPPPPCAVADFTSRGNIWGLDDPRYRSAFHWGECSVSLMDRDAGIACFWVRDHRTLPCWAVSSPLRSILHWWLETHGMQLIHAAAVGTPAETPGGGVLLPGRGGSGKSSTALECLRAGMRYVADDYLAVALDPEPRAHSLYATAKVDEAGLEHFADLAAEAAPRREPGWDKTVLFLTGAFGDRLAMDLPIDRVLLPSVSGEPRSELAPARALDVEQAIAFETLAHLPHAGAATARTLIRLSREVPHAALRLGSRRAEIPDVVAESLGEPPSGGVTMPAEARPDEPPLPWVSVILGVRPDDHDGVAARLDHALAQSYPRIELIVVSNGCGDATAQALEAFAGDVHHFGIETPVAPADARNRGIREAFADLVIFLDAGDRWPPGTLDRLVRAAGTDGEVVRGAGGSGSVAGTLFRKAAFRRCGLFDPRLHRGEGIDWLRRAHAAGFAIRELDAATVVPRPAPTSGPGVDLEHARRLIRGFKTRLDRRRAGSSPAQGSED